MRNLAFERQWIVEQAPDAQSATIRLISRASNDEGEFIVHREGFIAPLSDQSVKHGKEIMLDQCSRDERHINRGYGRPIEWPLSIRIRRRIRRWLEKVGVRARSPHPR